jgi:hypothetical protein
MRTLLLVTLVAVASVAGASAAAAAAPAAAPEAPSAGLGARLRSFFDGGAVEGEAPHFSEEELTLLREAGVLPKTLGGRLADALERLHLKPISAEKAAAAAAAESLPAGARGREGALADALLYGEKGSAGALSRALAALGLRTSASEIDESLAA